MFLFKYFIINSDMMIIYYNNYNCNSLFAISYLIIHYNVLNTWVDHNETQVHMLEVGLNWSSMVVMLVTFYSHLTHTGADFRSGFKLVLYTCSACYLFFSFNASIWILLVFLSFLKNDLWFQNIVSIETEFKFSMRDLFEIRILIIKYCCYRII